MRMEESTIQKNTSSYYSHGKLMLAGEYLVLEGARALALPLNKGQSLKVSSFPSKKKEINWKTIYNQELLLQATFRADTFEIIASEGRLPVENLRDILVCASKMNNNFPEPGLSFDIISELEFDPLWGFGSSSSLISNIAWWADVDPFLLNHVTMGGSGYDIACARAGSAIFFQKKEVFPRAEPATFTPPFINNLLIVYSGKKQSSRKALDFYKNISNIRQGDIEKISDISEKMASEENLENFANLMDEHEEIISAIINTPVVKKQLFSDFPGSIKSLGAWGGDCWLAASKKNQEDVKSYFRKKGFSIMFGLNELFL